VPWVLGFFTWGWSRWDVCVILTCICPRDGGTICQGRVTFLNAQLRILNTPLRKRQFYNSITMHQYKRFVRHQHESYNLGGYYAHPLLLIDEHLPLGINETTKAYTWSDLIPLREELVRVFADCSLVLSVIKLHCSRIQTLVFATIMKRSFPLLLYRNWQCPKCCFGSHIAVQLVSCEQWNSAPVSSHILCVL